MQSDWEILINSSEIFRSYVKSELTKEQKNKKTAEQKTAEELEIMDNFEAFQLKINASPKLRQSFKKLQHIFSTNSKYTATVNPKFVEGVMLLNLDDEVKK